MKKFNIIKWLRERDAPHTNTVRHFRLHYDENDVLIGEELDCEYEMGEESHRIFAVGSYREERIRIANTWKLVAINYYDLYKRDHLQGVKNYLRRSDLLYIEDDVFAVETKLVLSGL
jgi:hypothetical protein